MELCKDFILIRFQTIFRTSDRAWTHWGRRKVQVMATSLYMNQLRPCSLALTCVTMTGCVNDFQMKCHGSFRTDLGSEGGSWTTPRGHIYCSTMRAQRQRATTDWSPGLWGAIHILVTTTGKWVEITGNVWLGKSSNGLDVKYTLPLAATKSTT